MGRLDGKVAVITGAASGIGRRTAEVFVEEGAKVVVADLDEERGRRVAEALGPQASFIRADVANGAEIRSAIEHALERFGRLDIMFNNAGFGGARDGIAELTEEGWDATMAVLLRAVFLGMKYAAAAMKPQRSGVILSTASVAGLPSGRRRTSTTLPRRPSSSSQNRSRSSWASTASGSTAYAPVGSRHRSLPAASTCQASCSTRCRISRRVTSPVANRSSGPVGRMILRRPRCGWRATRRSGSPVMPLWSMAG